MDFWGSSERKAAPLHRSASSKILPLLILFIFLAAFAFVGYELYLTAQKISSVTSNKMQARNVVLSKDGIKVGVKEIRNESYVDTTQSLIVKAWNLRSIPEYKIRFGWNSTAVDSGNGKKIQGRKVSSTFSSSR